MKEKFDIEGLMDHIMDFVASLAEFFDKIMKWLGGETEDEGADAE